jgi:hypothetical protein
VRPTKDEKAIEVINKGGAYLVQETDKYEYYVVKGLTSGKLYDIIYNKANNFFSCSCKNLRFSDCYHVAAVKKIQENPLLEDL